MLMESVAVYFLEAAFEGVVGNYVDERFRERLRSLRERLAGEPWSPIQRAVRRACLRASESVCEARLAALGVNPALPPRKWAITESGRAEVAWLQRVRRELKNEMRALERGREGTPPRVDADGVARGLLGDPEMQGTALRETLVAQTLAELYRRHGPVPTTFRAMMREGWNAGGEAETERRNGWFELVCVYFRFELRTSPGLREIFETEILVPLGEEGTALTLDHVEQHLARHATAIAARLDRVERMLADRQGAHEVQVHMDGHFERLLPRLAVLPEMSEQLRLLTEAVNALRADGVAGAPEDGISDQEILDAYLEWMIGRHGALRIPGIPDVVASPVVELERVYVALRAEYTSRAEQDSVRELLDVEWAEAAAPQSEQVNDTYARRVGQLTQRALPRARGTEVSTLSLSEAFLREPRLVILGGPGAGKTTLARWLALKLSTAMRDGEEEVWVPVGQVDPGAAADAEMTSLGPARLPILLRVSEYARELLANRTPLDRFLGRHSWSDEYPIFPPQFPRQEMQGAPIPPERLNRLMLSYLRAGRAVVMLDGMDEIPDGNDRETVVAALESFIGVWIDAPDTAADRVLHGPSAVRPTRGDNQVVLTSRVTGYDLAPVSSIPRRVEVQPMNDQAVHSFCHAWTRAVHEIEHAGAEPIARDVAAAAHAQRLIQAIFDPRRPGVRDLARNPLLVTILAIVERNEGEQLPEHRTRLYDRALRYLVKVWRGAGLNEREALYVLEALAWHVHQSSQRTVPRGELYRLVEEHLAQYHRVTPGPAFREEVDRFVAALGREVGVVSEQGKELYGFLHQSFQEYLAARYLLRQPDVGSALAPLLGLPRWREPVLMALGYASWGEGWDDTAREGLHAALLADDDRLGGLLPRGALLLCTALPEMVRPFSDATADAVLRRLVAVYADSERMASFPAMADQVASAAVGLLTLPGVVGAGLRRRLVDLLLDAVDENRDTFLALSAILLSTRWRAPEVLEILLDGAHLDGPDRDWPVHRLLHDAAEHIPAHRLPLRRALEGTSALRERVASDAPWQRVVAVLCGGVRPEGFSPSFMYRDTPLAPLLLEVLRAGHPAASLAPLLRARVARGGREATDALAALAALGEDVGEALGEPGAGTERAGELLPHLAAAARLLEPVMNAGAGTLGRLLTLVEAPASPAVGWRSGVRPERPVTAVGFGDRLLALATAFAASPDEAGPPDGATTRARLTELLTWLFGAVEDTAEHRAYVAAVLDVAGAALEASPEQLANALRAAWTGRAEPEGGEDERWAEVAQAVNAVPPSLPWVRAWLLEALEPVLPRKEWLLLHGSPSPLDRELTELDEEDARPVQDAAAAAARLLNDSAARDFLLALARRSAGRGRAATIAEFIANVTEARGDDPFYSNCVILDTAGQVLEGPVRHLAWALARAQCAPGSRLQSWNLERLYPRPRSGPRVLTAALAAVSALPRECDGWKSWALQEFASLDPGPGAFRAEAAAVALGIHEPELRAEALRALVPRLDPSGDLRSMVVLMADALAAPDQARVLWRLALTQPLGDAAPLLQRARDAALAASGDPGEQALMLWRLLPFFGGDGRMRSALEEATARVVDPDGAARALARLALVHADERRERLLRQVLDAVGTVANPREAAETLRELEPLLSAGGLREETAALQAQLGTASDRRFLDEAWFDLLFSPEAPFGSGRPTDANDLPACTALAVVALERQLRARHALPADLPGLWRALADPARRRDAAEALRERGTAHALDLTATAAHALDGLLAAGEVTTPLRVLPCVWHPAPSAVTVVRKWLDYPDAAVRRHAVVLLAEAGELRDTVPDLLAALREGDDRTRHRAALALYARSPFDRLHASALGPEALDALLRAEAAEADPGLRTVLYWCWWSSLVCDDPAAMEAWLRRAADGDETAVLLLESVSQLGSRTLDVLCSALRGLAAPVQVRVLEALASTLGARGVPVARHDRLRRVLQEFLPLQDERGRAARYALSHMVPPAWSDAERLLALASGAASDDETLVDYGRLCGAFTGEEVQWTEAVLVELARDPVAAAAAASGLVRLWKRVPAPEVLDRLAALIPTKDAPETMLEAVIAAARGASWGSDEDNVVAVGAALLNSHPELLDGLLPRMDQALSTRRHPDGSFLASLVAAAAETSPTTFATRVHPRLAEPPLLRAASSRNWIARRSALRALAHLRTVTPRAVAALQAAMRDVAYVQDSALLATTQFRRIEGRYLEGLLAQLDGDATSASAAAAYTVGSLLVALGREERTDLADRQRIVEALARAIRAPHTREDVYVVAVRRERVTRDGQEHESIQYGTLHQDLRHAGRLDHCFYQMLAQIAGVNVTAPGVT